MLSALADSGIRETTIVVGHCADQVRALAGKRLGRMAIRYIENPAYTKGSVLSLYAAREQLTEPALVMDADVLFPREFLRRLLAVPAPSALLIDRGFADTGEEVKLYTRRDRVIALGKKVVPEAWEAVGEGIGFFKCGAAAGPEFVQAMEHVIASGDGLNEYEDALHILVQRVHVGWVDVTGLPWTEIDFAEDLRRAEDEVLPRLVRVDADG
jgi:L-glutamine-phosphate cytidylyltransferase